MTQANITDTGLRGYFKWLLQDQPGLAVQVIGRVAQQVPAAFSDYDQGKALGRLRGLADDSSDLLDTDLFDGTDTSFDATSGTGFASGILDTSVPLDDVGPDSLEHCEHRERQQYQSVDHLGNLEHS